MPSGSAALVVLSSDPDPQAVPKLSSAKKTLASKKKPVPKKPAAKKAPVRKPLADLSVNVPTSSLNVPTSSPPPPDDQTTASYNKHDTALENFNLVTNQPGSVATNFLRAHDWDVHAAIDAYFNETMATT